MKAPHSLYRRSLPGGGYVAIESTPESEAAESASAESASARVHAQLLVERRADPVRRVGHTPPVVAEMTDDNAQHALDALVEIAADNVEVARALLKWQSKGGKA